ncbi:MAG: hypothetical protein ACM33T_00910 [Solirubrobacterales bacterium]
MRVLGWVMLAVLMLAAPAAWADGWGHRRGYDWDDHWGPRVRPYYGYGWPPPGYVVRPPAYRAWVPQQCWTETFGSGGFFWTEQRCRPMAYAPPANVIVIPFGRF